MPLTYPDTSDSAPWRRAPKQRDYPIRAFRVWGLSLHTDGKWILESATMSNVVWEGPVIRAHVKPYDAKLWDKKKAIEKHDGKRIYSNKQWIEVNGVLRPINDEEREEVPRLAEESFSVGGIHAVKTREQSQCLASSYQVSVYGEVQLWGRVAEFTRGYRAELCMVRKLWLIRDSYNLVSEVRGHEDWRPHSEEALAEIQKDFVPAIFNDLSARYDCEVTCD